jgi:hypothetical protein
MYLHISVNTFLGEFFAIFLRMLTKHKILNAFYPQLSFVKKNIAPSITCKKLES